MLGELEEELRKLLRGLDGQTAIFLGCFAVLGAQMAWIAAKGPLPAPPALPTLTGLAAILAAHSFFLASRGLQHWINAVDMRLGPGSGWALLESAMLSSKAFSLESGQGEGAGEFKLRRGALKVPGPIMRARRMAWLAPLILTSAAVLFKFQNLESAALVCGGGALLGALEAVKLQRMMQVA